MVSQLNKQTIGVGIAGTGFIGPAHIEGLVTKWNPGLRPG